MKTTDGRRVKLAPAGPIQEYAVLVQRVDDRKAFDSIGTVRYWERSYSYWERSYSYWERSYNLRRVYVSRGWRARDAHGERVGYHENDATADTRKGAVIALVKHAGLEVES